MIADFLLIQKMKLGNEQAFDTFVRKYYADILKYCSYHCYDKEYAEDLTQETFLNFFAKLSDYHFKGKTKNYLYTIAGNLCRNFYKKKKEVLLEDETLSNCKLSYDLGQVVDKILIDTAINSLPKELREAIVLYYFQGLKIAEIADKLQIGISLVKYRLSQARKQLEHFVREEEFHEEKKEDGRKHTY